MKKKEIIYFDKPGKTGTAAVIEAVRAAVAANGIKHVVVASTSGTTALEYARALGKEISVVAVTYHAGWHGGDKVAMLPTMRATLEAEGIPVVQASHALSGISRSVSMVFGGPNYPELIAATLKMFGQGVKVAVEVAVMAADAGLIPTDRDCIAAGGSGVGSDSAIVLRPAHQNNFFKLRIREVLAMVRGGGEDKQDPPE